MQKKTMKVEIAPVGPDDATHMACSDMTRGMNERNAKALRLTKKQDATRIAVMVLAALIKEGRIEITGDIAEIS